MAWYTAPDKDWDIRDDNDRYIRDLLLDYEDRNPGTMEMLHIHDLAYEAYCEAMKKYMEYMNSFVRRETSDNTRDETLSSDPYPGGHTSYQSTLNATPYLGDRAALLMQ